MYRLSHVLRFYFWLWLSYLSIVPIIIIFLLVKLIYFVLTGRTIIFKNKGLSHQEFREALWESIKK